MSRKPLHNNNTKTTTKTHKYVLLDISSQSYHSMSMHIASAVSYVCGKKFLFVENYYYNHQNQALYGIW